MKLSAERVGRLRYGYLLSDRLDDWIEAHVRQPWADRLIDLCGRACDRIDRAVTPRICAHDEAVPDHCGIPTHDRCRGCDKPMPGQSRRPEPR